ncbi:MAG: hypothetical protein ACYC4P_11565 [Thermoanaerobaculia bacterium]
MDEREAEGELLRQGPDVVERARARLRRRLLDLRPEVAEPEHDPACTGLDELFVRRDPRRTCGNCEALLEEIARVEGEPLGLWPSG